MTKHLLGLLACVVAMAVGTGITFYLEPPALPPPPPPPIAPPPAEPVSSASITTNVDQVTLDRSLRRSLVSMDLRCEGPVPERVWVWTAFFTADGKRIFSSDPVEMPCGARFSGMLVNAPAPWVGGEGDPGAGYYARVFVSARSAEDARASERRLDTTLDGALPVVVLGDEPRRR